MPGYIFLPVPTEEMLEEARTWTSGQTEKGKVPYIILRNSSDSGLGKAMSRLSSGGCLKEVSPNSKVYILAHGSGYGDTEYIGADRSYDFENNAIGASYGDQNNDAREAEWKKYTPREMALLLKREGLTRRIRQVNVYACGSGIEGREMPSWAARLKSEMNALGYNDVLVGGYTADVKTSYVARYIHDLTGADVWSDSTHKGAYDAESMGSVRASSTKVVY